MSRMKGLAGIIAALIENVAVPELLAYLEARKTAGQPVDEAELKAKLIGACTTDVAIGEAALAAHGIILP